MCGEPNAKHGLNQKGSEIKKKQGFLPESKERH